MGKFSLMAGGLSQGLTDALAGANQGMLAGEDIRRGRAQEDLQQQHLGLQQQQLTNHLAQQAFQNAMAQQNMGLHRDQLDWQRMHGMRQLGIAEADEARKQALAPYEMKYKAASADWMSQRPDIYRERTDAQRERTDVMREHWQRVGQDAERRLAQAEQRLQLSTQRLGNQMSAEQRIQMNDIRSRLQNARQRLAIASNAAQYGVQVPGMPTPEVIMQEIAQIETELPNVSGAPRPPASGAAPGATPTGPNAPAQSPAAQIRSKWGLGGGK